jgi:hypothetical protein
MLTHPVDNTFSTGVLRARIFKLFRSPWIDFKKPIPSGCVAWRGSATHCKENPIYVFLFWELRGLSRYFHIHVPVSYWYIPRIVPHIFLQQNRQTDHGNMYIDRSQTHECGNWDWGRTIPFLGIFFSNFRYWVFEVHRLIGTPATERERRKTKRGERWVESCLGLLTSWQFNRSHLLLYVHYCIAIEYWMIFKGPGSTPTPSFPLPSESSTGDSLERETTCCWESGERGWAIEVESYNRRKVRSSLNHIL